jgi:antitoxin (DNA-binding transcriptional repressor) of toxin-antitoxin stability system
MTQATIHQAKTHLSKLIGKALDGEEVIIANRDKPLVRLEPLIAARRGRRIGGLKHWRRKQGHDFNEPKLNREIERDFYRADPRDPLDSK